MGWNCCRRHVKGEEATSNTKIVANMPAAAAGAAAAATSTFAATIITANIIDQTFTRFFSVGESRHYWYILNQKTISKPNILINSILIKKKCI